MSAASVGSAVTLVEQLSCSEVLLPAQVLGELSRVLTGKARRSASQTREAVLSRADSFLADAHRILRHRLEQAPG